MNGLEEIVYENRNKEYGSYMLRKNYHKYLLTGFLLSLVTVLVPIFVLFFYSYFDIFNTGNVVPPNKDELTQMTYLADIYLPLPPPAAPEPRLSFTPPTVTDSAKDEQKPKQEAKKPEEDNKGAITDSSANKTMADKATKTDSTSSPGDSLIYVNAADKMPEFIGGDQAFANFLRQSFSTSVNKNKVRGALIIQFIISKTGFIRDVSILSGVDPLIDKEMLRVILASPPWRPAQRSGRPISVRCSIRIFP
jgi:protein TonB